MLLKNKYVFTMLFCTQIENLVTQNMNKQILQVRKPVPKCLLVIISGNRGSYCASINARAGEVELHQTLCML